MSDDNSDDDAAAELQLKERSDLRELKKELKQARAECAAKMAELSVAAVFQNAKSAAIKLGKALPRGKAAGVINSLMKRMEGGVATMAELGVASAIRPRKIAGSTFRIAHQNMGCCYGTNGGPALLPEKLKNLRTLLQFYEVDVVVCTEMPAGASKALEHALAEEGSTWGYTVSEPVSWAEARFPEHVVWVYNTKRMHAPGPPKLIDDWVRRSATRHCVKFQHILTPAVVQTASTSRVPAYLDLFLQPKPKTPSSTPDHSRKGKLQLYGCVPCDWLAACLLPLALMLHALAACTCSRTQRARRMM